MMTVKELSTLSGVTVRALHWYDEIGLLPPQAVTEAGYRLYGEESLSRLQLILLLRELEFPLKDIKAMLDARDFDLTSALSAQITLLNKKKEHLDGLIAHARALIGSENEMKDFKAYDKSKLKAYEQEAKRAWGDTAAYKEYERKTQGQSEADMENAADGLMAIFADFGKIKDQSPASPEAQAQVKTLQDYITGHYYTCTKEILSGLGQMYASGGEMTENIDKAGGKGTAVFAANAIQVYCK